MEKMSEVDEERGTKEIREDIAPLKVFPLGLSDDLCVNEATLWKDDSQVGKIGRSH